MPSDHISEVGNVYDAVRRYGLAILAASAALLLRQVLSPLLGESNPYHTVWAAVFFSAWYCGLGPSIITVLLSVVGVWYWFLPPAGSFALRDPKTAISGMAGFLLLSGLIIATGEANRRFLVRTHWAEEQLRKAHNELEVKVQERTADLKLANESLHELSGRLQQTLIEVNEDIDKGQDGVVTYLAKLDATAPKEATQKLRDLVGKEFRALFSAVSVTQTRIRVFLIELPPVDLTVNQAIQIALLNRLDLQNSLATVTDAWRAVEVDANQLMGFLNFVYNGNFNESPNHNGLFHFDAGNTIQTFGLQFDAPINRRQERNTFRADQIQYQRTRRAYMQNRDTIVQQIRLDMRNLELFERTFEVNREQILSAATQLESAEEEVRFPTDVTSSATLSLLQALNSVLGARNALIQTWVLYETSRLSLYRDFDLMDIDANGVWTNENDPTAIDIALRHAQSAPAFSLTIPARIPDLSPGIPSDSTFYIDVEPGGKPNKPPDAADDPVEDALPLDPLAPGAARPGDARPAAPPGAPSPFAPARPAP